MRHLLRSYNKRVVWSDEDESFVATCLEFPGLSGIGENESEALAELAIALELVAEIYTKKLTP